MTPATVIGAALPAVGGPPLTGLTLATLLLITTVIEQGWYILAPFGRYLWMTAITSLVYGLVAWVLSGRLVVGLVLAALTTGTRFLLRRAVDPQPPTLWKGLAQTTGVHVAVVLCWVFLQPLPAPWFVNTGSWLVTVLTGAPAGVEGLVRVITAATAYVFVWGSGTVITRAALGLDDYLAGWSPAGPRIAVSSSARRHTASASPAHREAEVSAAAHRQAAAALDQEPMYRWGRLIGNLERFIILTLTLHGQLAAVGFVLAAKSVARFEMVREHAEYFLVGTLTSTGLALTVGLIVHGLLG